MVVISTIMRIQYITVNYDKPDGFGTSSRDIGAALIREHIDWDEQPADIALIYHHPEAILRARAKYKILYTMFESTKPPASWKQYIDMADLVLVPSQFCKRAFDEAYGIDSQVVPLGYKTNVFTYQKRPIDRQPFTFLMYDCNIRKGFVEAWEAFRLEFKETEQVRMIFKTAKPQVVFPPIWPNMEVIRDEYSPLELVGLLQQSDCFVFPSRGEGFGHTPLEAMGTGLPVITVNAHAIADYFNPSCMLGVEWNPINAEYDYLSDPDLGNFVRADIDSLRQAMRYAFEHRAEMQAMGFLAESYATKWSWEWTDAKLSEIINQFKNKP